MKFLGCLFIFFFFGIFLLLNFARHILSLFFGPLTKQQPGARTTQQGSTDRAYGPHRSQTGNAQHERNAHNANSRQRRSGKIFEKNEGEYVDFEEM